MKNLNKLLAIPLFFVVTAAKAVTTDSSMRSISNAVQNPLIEEHQFVDLGLSVKWATTNVGAATPEAYGDYYAWGEIVTKTNYGKNNAETKGLKLGCISGNPTYDVATALWGKSARIPTQEEFQELMDRCESTWTQQNGVYGLVVKSKVNGNTIFLPAAGYHYNAMSYQIGESGSYWTSSPDEGNSEAAYRTGFGSGYFGNYWSHRGFGRTVRPVEATGDENLPGPNPEPDPKPDPDPNPEPEPNPDQPLTEITLFNETFDGTTHSFTIDNKEMESPLQTVWKLETYKNKQYIKANSYNKGQGGALASEGWIISPIVDLTDCSEATLSFEHAISYFDSPRKFLEYCSVKIKEADSDVWEDLSIENVPNNRFELERTMNDLDFYVGKKIQLAWVYTSTTQFAGLWQIKNIRVDGKRYPTGITVPQHQSTSSIYDLQGRKVKTCKKGLYIVDGKKFFVR